MFNSDLPFSNSFQNDLFSNIFQKQPTQFLKVSQWVCGFGFIISVLILFAMFILEPGRYNQAKHRHWYDQVEFDDTFMVYKHIASCLV